MLRAAGPMLSVHRGLYVQYFFNDSDQDVHDRNGERHGRGKKVIPSGRWTIKIGKFINGLLARRAEDAVHLHRRQQGDTRAPNGQEFLYPPELSTYLDCLVSLIVLDLGSPPKEDVTVAENQLRNRLDRFLDERGLQVQDRNGDYRILETDPGPQFQSDLEEWATGTLSALSGD